MNSSHRIVDKIGAQPLAVLFWFCSLFLGRTEPTSLVPLPDGNVLVAGTFLTIGGQAATNLVRLNPDLSIDSTFRPDPFFLKAGNKLLKAAVSPDGKILLLGNFQSKRGYSAVLNRVNSDGSHDDHFVAATVGALDAFNSVTDVKVDGNGNIFVAGLFDTGVGGYENPRLLMRLLPDGTRDPLFSANRTANPLHPVTFLSSPKAVQLGWTGRIFLGGWFAEPDGLGQRHYLHGFSSDGIPEFQTGGDFDLVTQVLFEDQQERILVAGTVYSLGVPSGPGWVRLKADGTVDASFAPPSPVPAILQAESLRTGGILALLSDGHLLNEYSDNGTFLGTLATNVSAFAIESSGDILAASGGEVQRYQALSDNSIPGVEIVWGSLSISEGANEIRVAVRRTGNADSVASVNYSVTAGSAVAGVDFIPTNGVLNFEPGTREMAIIIPLTAQNQVPNDDRTLEVQLSTATGLALHPRRAHCTVTLKDDDTGLTSETFSYTVKDPFPRPSLLLPQSYFQKRVSTRIDPVVHEDWGTSQPLGVTNNIFSVIWTGWIVPETNGIYTIGTIAKNGSRIWLDDRLVVNTWTQQISLPSLLSSTNVSLQSGRPYRMVVQYEAGTADSVCRLVWRVPDSTNITTIPQRVLRPGTSRLIPPILFCSTTNYSQFTVQYGGDSERPIVIEMTTNGTQWTFLGEGIVRTNGTTESFSTAAGPVLPAGTQFRATTIDGLSTLFSQQFAFSASDDLNLAAGSTNSVTFTAYWGSPGSSIVWQKDGVPVGTNFQWTVSATDLNAQGTYQAIITTPQGMTNSPEYPVRLFHVPLVSPTLISSSSANGLSGPQFLQVSGNFIFWGVNQTSSFSASFAGISNPTNIVFRRVDYPSLPLHSLIQPYFQNLFTCLPDGTFYQQIINGPIPSETTSVKLPNPGILSMAADGLNVYVADPSGAVDILFWGYVIVPAYLVGSYQATSPVTSIQVERGVAYMAGRDGGLEIVDLHDPKTPVRLGHLTTSPLANLKLSGSHLYATSVTEGLMVMDIGDPVTPRLITTRPLHGTPLALSVRGNRVAVALDTAGADLFDVSNPEIPIVIGHFPGQLLGLDMDASHVYAVDKVHGLTVWDLGPQLSRNLYFFPTSPVVLDNTPIALTVTDNKGDVPSATFRVVSGPAMVSSNQLVFTGIGQAVVEARVEGDTQYLPTSGVQRGVQALASLQIAPDSVQWTAPGELRVTFPTAPGGNYELQSSEDLVHWTGHGIATANDVTTSVTNRVAGGTKVFLRVNWR
jgi:uncharacterized delta-60 repeat protein